MRPAWFKVLVGAAVADALDAEKETRCPHSKRPGMEQYYESGPLCEWQSSVHQRGFRAVNLVKSIYGWSVRSDSGLDNFALMAGARSGELDGTYEDALRWASEWCADAPTLRYVWVRESELQAA